MRGTATGLPSRYLGVSGNSVHTGNLVDAEQTAPTGIVI